MLKRQEIFEVDFPTQNLALPMHLLPTLGEILSAYNAEKIQVISPDKFEKQTAHSRYLIASPNKIQSLSVPIHHSSRGLPFHEAKIDYNQKWVKDHKQALQSAYGKSAFFEFYDYRFFQVLDQQPETLESLSKQWLTILHQNLGWPSQLQFLTSNNASFNQEVNPIPTSEPHNSTPITKQNRPPIIHPYAQVFEHKYGFRADVSAIDLLFNLGPLAKEYIYNTIFVSQIPSPR